jgi:hypothetical protein
MHRSSDEDMRSCLEERETETAESRSVFGSGPVPKTGPLSRSSR